MASSRRSARFKLGVMIEIALRGIFINYEFLLVSAIFLTPSGLNLASFANSVKMNEILGRTHLCYIVIR